MKKTFFLIFIIINTIGSINAEEENVFSLQIANWGVNQNFSRQKINTDLCMEFFNFYFENYIKNVGFKISPLSIYRKDNFYEMNFLNISSHLNLLNNKQFVLGPFFSLLYLSLIDWQKFDPKNITINTGLKFFVKDNYYKFIGTNYIVETEVGYKYNSYNRHQFYFGAKIDLIATFVIIGKIGHFFSP
jgi:hypothetical protein